MTYDNPWTYNDKVLETEDVEPYLGMVYLIINLETGRKYVGKKLFKFTKSKKVKGKRKRSLVESDWKDYYGSNNELLAEAEQIGKEKFKRTVLRFCKSKAECTYWELYEQVTRDAILSDEYYNEYIMARVRVTESLKKSALEG